MHQEASTMVDTKNFNQGLKFLVVGGISTLVNYGVFSVTLTLVKQSPLIAAAFGYMSGVGVGFVGNKYYSFQSSSKEISETMRYLGVYLSTLFVSLVLAHFINANVFSYVFIIGVTTVLNYLGCRFLVFKNEN